MHVFRAKRYAHLIYYKFKNYERALAAFLTILKLFGDSWIDLFIWGGENSVLKEKIICNYKFNPLLINHPDF